MYVKDEYISPCQASKASRKVALLKVDPRQLKSLVFLITRYGVVVHSFSKIIVTYDDQTIAARRDVATQFTMDDGDRFKVNKVYFMHCCWIIVIFSKLRDCTV